MSNMCGKVGLHARRAHGLAGRTAQLYCANQTGTYSCHPNTAAHVFLLSLVDLPTCLQGVPTCTGPRAVPRRAAARTQATQFRQ
jgi:hypothetical protein